MKNLRYFVVSAALAAAFVMTGCATTAKGGSSGGNAVVSDHGLRGVPDFVNKAYQNASDDVLVGVGSYMIGDDAAKTSHAKTMAETRARADISRQLVVINRQMINDYTVTNELDPGAALSFQEQIDQQLSRAELRGSRTVAMDKDSDGLLWVVIQYDKSAAASEYSAAANAAKLAVPAAAAFDALSRMETAFSKEAGGGPVPVGD